ncbi:alpha/beta fold hydrolase [Mesorhizobium sp. WSM3879]|uniref:alpha/beta fold hydrolase n=1 Tax=Mesorhizobium sp. WSM3879 TaxID=2029406 RepID=UPI0032AF6DCA
MITQHRISVGDIATSYCEAGAGSPLYVYTGDSSRREEFLCAAVERLSDQLEWSRLPSSTSVGRIIPLITIHQPPGSCGSRAWLHRSAGLKQITLVGNSEGSFVAARVAIVRPDIVSKLVLLTANSVSPALGDDRDDAWMQTCQQACDYSGPMPNEQEYVSRWWKGPRACGQDVEDAKREACGRAAAIGQWSYSRSCPKKKPICASSCATTKIHLPLP